MFMEYIRMINECETKASQSSRYYSQNRTDLNYLFGLFQQKCNDTWTYGIEESYDGKTFIELRKLSEED